MLKLEHKAIADQYIKQGYKNKRKAVLTVQPDLSIESASVKGVRVLNSDKVRTYLIGKAKQHAENIHKLGLSAQSEAVRLQASKDILDRAGVGIQAKQAPPTDNTPESREQLQALLSSLKAGNDIELYKLVLRPKT